jgi:NADPH:quinone reductase-like Zn-dependent oxidoreductase
MKKIIYSKFGGAEELQIAEVPIPTVQATTILIKVKAVSINPLDWKIRNGEMKLMSGSKFPRGIGIDFSGIVEETGAAATKYNKGDEVFGILDVFKGGASSEYITVEEKDITIKPKNISFEQAAAMPVVGSAALQIFKTLVSLKKGTEILINGASGGIGMFATQIAKMSGAIVTTVVGDSGIPAGKDWGADFIVNYRNEDVLKGNKQYDVVIDLSGKMPFTKAKKIMKHSSAYIHTPPDQKKSSALFSSTCFQVRNIDYSCLSPLQNISPNLQVMQKVGLRL